MNRLIVVALLAAPLLGAAPPLAAQSSRTGVQAFRDCPTCPEMVILPAGTFVMGTPAAELAGVEASGETQPTVVRIARPFAIGRFEVTRREFAQFVADSGYEARAGCRTWDDGVKRFTDDARRIWSEPGRPAQPGDTLMAQSSKASVKT